MTMVVLPGMLRVMLFHRWRGSLAVGATSVLSLRVWPNDLDLNLHVNNGRYFTLADVGRMDWWFRTGTIQAGLKRGWRPTAGDATAKFSRELLLFQGYSIHSRMLGFDAKWIYNEHRFMRGERVHATVVVRSVILSKDGKVPPADWLALVGWKTPSPPLPDWVVAWADAQDRLTTALRSPVSPPAQQGGQGEQAK
jgi:acyl-CoA thioesterase FadM